MYGRQKNKHGRQNNKQRLKSYAAQIKNAEATFEAEISKPVEDRDGDLLLECLETLEFFHERVDALVAQEHNNRPATPIFRSRFALIAAVLLVAALLVSCVAQTLGFRIGSALIHWDAGYLSVDYVPKNQGELSEQEIANDESLILEEDESSGIKEYATMDDALRDLNIAPMLPSKWPEPFDIEAIRGESNTQRTYAEIKYASDSHKLMYTISKYIDMESVVNFTSSNSGEYEKYERSGISYVINKAQPMAQATWTSNNYVYCFDTDLPYEDILSVIDALSVVHEK